MAEIDKQRYRDVKTAIHENADYMTEYLTSGTITKAKALLTALTQYLALVPELLSHGGSQAEEFREDKESMLRLQKQVLGFLRGAGALASGRGGFYNVELARGEKRSGTRSEGSDVTSGGKKLVWKGGP